MKIKWTDLAKFQLKGIFIYHKSNVSEKVAEKIRKSVVDAVHILYKNPLAGPTEPLLIKRNKNFRYLVQGNYKIIYWIDKEIIFIASVFDCRQNPTKMKVV